MTRISLFAFLCGLSILMAGAARAEMNECRARTSAMDFVRKKMGLEPSHQLRATRREDLEDDLFRLQVKVKGQIAKAAYFYEVTENGYFVLSPDEAVYVNSADGERMWMVAVPIGEEPPYGLYGFPDGAAEFCRLVRSARLDIRADADAETAALLFFTTVKDPRRQNIVFGAMQLRHRIEDYWTSRLPETKAESRSSAWWRGFGATKSGSQLGVKVTRAGDGYDASVTFISSDGGKYPQLTSLAVRVSGIGACDVVGTKVVYRPRE
jgi:hypothetical protein